MKTVNPEDVKPLGDLVTVRRLKPESHTVANPARSGSQSEVRIAYETSQNTALVIPSISSDITRATVVAVGPGVKHVKPGDIVGVPGQGQDAPAMRTVDENGETWEGWRESQLDYIAAFVEVTA